MQVIGESRLDWKYEQIINGLQIEYNVAGAWDLIRSVAAGRSRVDCLHLRYLKWRGYLTTLPYYLIVIALSLFRGVPLIWTRHNVSEYSFPSEIYNKIVAALVAGAAHRIIVFDQTLVSTGKDRNDKVLVSSLGGFRGFFEDGPPPRSCEAEAFCAALSSWLDGRADAAALLVFIGAYHPSKHVDWLLKGLRRGEVSGVVIAPGLGSNWTTATAFVYGGKENLKSCVPALLRTPGTIGYLAHSNGSVPTGLYVYGSYGVPIVAYDCIPLNGIVRRYCVGEVFQCQTDLVSVADSVEGKYSVYAEGWSSFWKHHSWNRARDVHRTAFEGHGAGLKTRRP